MKHYEAVVVGVSAGGLDALSTVLPALPERISVPVIVVAHRAADSDSFVASHLDDLSKATVREAEYGERLRAGTVYIAPAGYHLHVESDRTLRLSVDQPVHCARPSVDVLFFSAAEVYGHSLVGVVLTGTNSDGAAGLRQIKVRGGLAVVQDSATAQADAMPRAAMEAVCADHVLDLEEIGPFLGTLCADEELQRSRVTTPEQDRRSEENS